MQKLVPIGEATQILKVSIDTIRRYDKLGILHSTRPGGKIRYFDLEELKKVKSSKPVAIFVPSKANHLKRVSSLLIKALLLLLTLLTILFLLFPEKMARLLTSFM